ncbi:MAG: PQQ-binding-like beta-propeller repeat protein [Verrucomicrobia bacterium]|nr:PQQ-binding-like beta-propeller repeat protein [Verrucomicrobiota bacterium]
MLTPVPSNLGGLPAAGGESTKGRLFRSVQMTATVAGLFSLIVLSAMVFERIRLRPVEILQSEEIEAATRQLRNDLSNEALKQAVRDQDARLRYRYFRELSVMRTGGYLLFGGLVVTWLSMKTISRLRRKLPMPQPKNEIAGEQARSAVRARWTLSALSVAGVATLALLSLVSESKLPDQLASLDESAGHLQPNQASRSPVFPSREELLNNWPRFRGAGGNGIATRTNLPVTWDVASGNGIVWKSPVPGIGFNSPVVWNDRVFLTGGDQEKRAVYCFDASTGSLLWTAPVENVPGSPTELPDIPEETGFAAPTAATDGRRVFAIFANGDIAAIAFDGSIVWTKNLGLPKNSFGHATSLVVWQDRLLVQIDQEEEAKSTLYALDVTSGRTVWQRRRPVGTSWATPIVIETGSKPQIVTLGSPWVISYDPANGTELWRAECLEGEITPSPVFAAGLVLAVSPSNLLLAIRPDGSGDVSGSHIQWKAEGEIPDITSPVAHENWVFTINSWGILTCFATKDGSKLWEHELDMDVHASPSIAGNRLFIVGLEGRVIVVEATAEFKELARTEMGERIAASPAFANDRMFIRGRTNLFCIGAATGEPVVQTAAK